jgi:ATP-binding cassette subfamily B protein
LADVSILPFDLARKLKHILRVDRAVRLAWAAGPGWGGASLVLVVIQGVLPLAALYVMKLLVDAVAGTLSRPESGAGKEIAVLVCAAGAVALIEAACRFLGDMVKEGQAQAVTDYMYHLLHAKSVSVDLGFYENPRYLDTLHRAQEEGPFRPTRIVNTLLSMGQSSVSVLAVAALLFSLHWGVPLVLIAAALPGVFLRIKYSQLTYRWREAQTGTERKSRYYNWMLTGDAHAKEVRLFGLGAYLMARFNALRKILREQFVALHKKRAAAEFLAQTGSILAVFATLGYLSWRVSLGAVTIGGMIMYFQAFQRGMGHFRELLGGLADLYENNLFLSNFYDFIDYQPQVAAPAVPLPVPAVIQTGVVFDQVGFRYPGAGKDVLTEVSFTLSPGEVVALVGENGSGKTTLVKLLCRLYDPCRGAITVDGIDIRSFDPNAFRNLISVTFQDFMKYQLPASENICFGNIALPKEGLAIEKAARAAGAHHVISGLPAGYDTMLGKWFENGEELSVGQWQKVALARAFYRNAPILVLDEPTSALDVQTEYEVLTRFRSLLNGNSAVLISHRLSTIRMADKILVLDQGRILHIGTHDELTAIDGVYAEMVGKNIRP